MGSGKVLLEEGGSSLPSLRTLHRILRIDERDFMRETQATFKLGTQLRDWLRPGESFFHPFGETGGAIETLPFHQHWLKMRQAEGTAGRGSLITPLSAYAIAAVAASSAKFAHPASDPRSVGATLDYAYHLDPVLYARYLRAHARVLGIECIEGNVLDVSLRADDGFIESLRLDGDRAVKGDLFIDASGLAGCLIERAIGTGYESWSHWLPCDRAVSVSTLANSGADIVPYTAATARAEGWQWRIPLRRRVSHGYVYCSLFSSDQSAKQTLLDHLDGPPIDEPEVVSFVCGRREQLWARNCVALGAAASFLDPLAATQAYLIHSGLAKLLALFPYRDRMGAESEEYNRLMGSELERVRDFLILHYSAPRRRDSAFWTHCGSMTIPASLERKINLFASRGRVVLYDHELFGESSWACLLTGLGVWPRSPDPLTETTDPAAIQAKLEKMRVIILRAVQAMLKHQDYLERYCPLPGPLPGDRPSA
jgi:tryptophan halogenase